MSEYHISAFDLKLALLQYYRFRRQCVCVSEYLNADIVADSGKEIIEIEVKISLYDLLNGEKRKRKHIHYRNGRGWGRLSPNRYSFCVPEQLVDTALEYIKELNPKYRLIAFNSDRFYSNLRNNRIWQPYEYLRVCKSPKKLHEEYYPHKWEMAKRASSEVARSYYNQFKKRLEGKYYVRIPEALQ